MKRILLAALILSAASLSSHGLGLYFDGGIGFGQAWTTINGEDWAKKVTKSGATADEMGLDLGIKLGIGPFDTIPIYVVGVWGGMGHRISDDANHYQFDSYLIGPGVIFYPAPFVQIAASLGYSYIANETSFKSSNIGDYESKGGFAGDISVAFDFGAGNHGLLGGIRFFGSTNTWEVGNVVQNSSMVSFFVRYAFRHKR